MQKSHRQEVYMAIYGQGLLENKRVAETLIKSSDASNQINCYHTSDLKGMQRNILLNVNHVHQL